MTEGKNTAAAVELKATQSKVHAVTVFQADRAEVVRHFSVDLKAGQNEVDISQLPTVLDEDSIRVDGIGSSAIISDVIYHPPTSNDSDKKHELAVKELQKDKSVLEQELEIFRKQASILEAYSQTLKGADTNGGQLSDFLDVYAKRQGGINAKVNELEDKIAEVDEKIKTEREVWSADDEGKKRAVRITVVVFAEEEGPAEISLTYLVSNASWTPLYDLRAAIKPDKTAISLQYRATIVQSTGEDWKDVELTLSTASPQLGSAIPKLSPLWINPIVAIRARSMKSKRMTSTSNMAPGSSMPPVRAMLANSASWADEMEDRSATLGGGGGFMVADAVPVEGAISTSYFIEGLSNIPSDTDLTSQAHKVTVAVVDLSADVEWIAVPKEQPSAFLQAKIKNTSPYLFLPGRANIFLDDNFVAKSEIEHVSPNESFNCSLGVDPQVKVTYHPRTKKSRSQGGLLVSRTVTTAFHQKVTVKNTRGTPINRLLVRDQIPISSDQRLKVSIIEPSGLEFPGRNTITSGGSGEKITLPKELKIARGVSVRWKIGDDEVSDTASTLGADGAREGILEWVCDIDAGKTTELNLAWDVNTPTGLNWGPQ